MGSAGKLSFEKNTSAGAANLGSGVGGDYKASGFGDDYQAGGGGQVKISNLLQKNKREGYSSS